MELNEGLETIGMGSFRDCASLRSIKVPTTVKHLGDHAFLNCSAMNAEVYNKGLQPVVIAQGWLV